MMTNDQLTDYKSVFKDGSKYVTPGRLLRRLKSRNDYPTRQIQSIDKASADRCAIGQFIYSKITSGYLPLLNGGADIHARHSHKVAIGNALSLEDHPLPDSLMTDGVWNYEEFLTLSALLPLNPVTGGVFSNSVQDIPDTTLERVIEGYVLAGCVLFPNKIRCAALKILLTHCGSGSLEMQRLEMVSKIAGLYRKKYGRNLFANKPGEREKYYMGSWFSFLPYFSFQARFETANFKSYARDNRLVDRSYLSKLQRAKVVSKDDFIKAYPRFAYKNLFICNKGMLTLQRKWSDFLVCHQWIGCRHTELARLGVLPCCW